MLNIPILSEELIKLLDKRIPHRCPKLTVTDRELWVYVGKRELIDSLLIALKRQENPTNVFNTKYTQTSEAPGSTS